MIIECDKSSCLYESVSCRIIRSWITRCCVIEYWIARCWITRCSRDERQIRLDVDDKTWVKKEKFSTKVRWSSDTKFVSTRDYLEWQILLRYAFPLIGRSGFLVSHDELHILFVHVKLYRKTTWRYHIFTWLEYHDKMMYEDVALSRFFSCFVDLNCTQKYAAQRSDSATLTRRGLTCSTEIIPKRVERMKSPNDMSHPINHVHFPIPPSNPHRRHHPVTRSRFPGCSTLASIKSWPGILRPRHQTKSSPRCWISNHYLKYGCQCPCCLSFDCVKTQH